MCGTKYACTVPDEFIPPAVPASPAHFPVGGWRHMLAVGALDLPQSNALDARCTYDETSDDEEKSDEKEQMPGLIETD